MKRTIVLVISMALFTKVMGQISTENRKTFVVNLAIRMDNQVGMNPHGPDALQVPFGPMDYKGVESVARKFIKDAYKGETPAKVEDLFEHMGADRDIFNDFIMQIVLYCDGDRKLAVRLIGSLGGNTALAETIFSQYWKENKDTILIRLKNNPYAADIAERKKYQ